MRTKYLITILFFAFFPFAADAKAIEFAVDNVKGNSSYDVEATSLKLKSKLIFPYNFERLKLSFSKKISYGNLNVGFSVPISHSKQTAKDYDWQNGQLTVFSTSDSKLSKYYSIHFEWVSKPVNRFSFSSKLLFQELDTDWSNTRQTDYVKNTEMVSKKTSLKYEQNHLLYSLGIDFLPWESNKTKIEIGTKFIIGLVESKDSHLLRGFYTLQDSKVTGFAGEIRWVYTLGSDNKLAIGYMAESLSGKVSLMDYYSGDIKYSSYPSRYKDKKNILNISYKKQF